MPTPLPRPAEKYSAVLEQRRNQLIDEELENRWQRFADIEVSTITGAVAPAAVVAGSRIILTSPDGTRYELTVSDLGAIETNPVA